MVLYGDIVFVKGNCKGLSGKCEVCIIKVFINECVLIVGCYFVEYGIVVVVVEDLCIM